MIVFSTYLTNYTAMRRPCISVDSVWAGWQVWAQSEARIPFGNR